jgi:tetratricopeptide (TPR) repeat protein
VAVRLVDNTTGVQLWSDVHRSPLEVERLVAFQEEVARAVAGTLSCEDGVITRALSTESKRKLPHRMQTYDAILRYYEYDQALSPETFARALPALERAVTEEPGCCQAWSMLGRLYGNIHGLDIPGFDAPLENAVRYAERAVQLNPGDQRSRAILSYVRFLADELPAAREEAERALALNPNSLIFLDSIGYLLTLQGDWERGPRLIRRAMACNPYYKPVAHYALWVDLVRQGDDEAAYREALKMQRPALFWDSLARAATLGLLGRGDEGGPVLAELLRLRPDVPERGRHLIGLFIKFEEIAERIVEGLRRSGLEIA